MAVQFLGVGALISALVGLLVWAAKEAWSWFKTEALKIAKNAVSLALWAASFLAVRLALAAALIAASEYFLEYVTRSYITPLAGNLFSRLLPSTSDGEFFHYIFWDSGLNAKEIVTQVLLYLVRYTQLFALFDLWLRSVHIALGAYRAGIKRMDAVLQSSLR